MVWSYREFQQKVQSRLSPEERHDPAKAPVPPYYPDTPITRRTVARYYDCITVMDKNVARILKELQDDGLADDTIVFFFSDHGMPGGLRHKQFCYEGGIHIPLLIRWPKNHRGTKPGRVVDDLVPHAGCVLVRGEGRHVLPVDAEEVRAVPVFGWSNQSRISSSDRKCRISSWPQYQSP